MKHLGGLLRWRPGHGGKVLLCYLTQLLLLPWQIPGLVVLLEWNALTAGLLLYLSSEADIVFMDDITIRLALKPTCALSMRQLAQAATMYASVQEQCLWMNSCVLVFSFCHADATQC